MKWSPAGWVASLRHRWVLPIVVAAGMLRVGGSLLAQPTWIRVNATRENWASPKDQLWKVRAKVHGFGICDSLRLDAKKGRGRVLGITEVGRVPAGEEVAFLVAFPVDTKAGEFEVSATFPRGRQREVVRLSSARIP